MASTATAPKLDLYEINKSEYAASAKPALIQMRPATYLSIEGRGAPGSTAFTDAIGALYGIAFTVKMTRKFAGLEDYSVCKLEALWPNWEANAASKDQWTWQLLIRTPEFITRNDIRQAAETLTKRSKGAGTDRVELRTLNEGLCVQAMHIGSYDTEEKTIAAMRAFAEKHGLRISGTHHEIYLSDPRRVPEAKLKTILREPVTAV